MRIQSTKELGHSWSVKNLARRSGVTTEDLKSIARACSRFLKSFKERAPSITDETFIGTTLEREYARIFREHNATSSDEQVAGFARVRVAQNKKNMRKTRLRRHNRRVAEDLAVRPADRDGTSIQTDSDDIDATGSQPHAEVEHAREPQLDVRDHAETEMQTRTGSQSIAKCFESVSHVSSPATEVCSQVQHSILRYVV